MIAETIFYITGSAFFILIVAINLATAFYLFKILRIFLKISEEINGTAKEIKGKVSNFYLGFAGLTALLEKLISSGFKRGDKGGGDKNDEKAESAAENKTYREVGEDEEVVIVKKTDNQPKKGKKIKRIKVMEISEE